MSRRFVSLAILFLTSVGGTGCQRYIELKNNSDRIWMISKDQTEVFRCWDLRNQTGKLIAVCRHAAMLGTNEGSAWEELAERSALAPHGDSTELAPLANPTSTPTGR